MSTACWIYSADQLTTAALTVAEDTPALRLFDPYADAVRSLPEDGIVLEEAAAKDLGVSAGDTVTLRFSGDPRLYPVQVSAIERTVSGAYLSRSLWRSMGQAIRPLRRLSLRRRSGRPGNGAGPLRLRQQLADPPGRH